MTDWAARLLNFKRGELRLALLAALFYFCVLSGYFFLRPVRDAMGVARGMDELRWLFAATSVVCLIIVLLFGGAVSRMDRRKFIPAGYGFVIVCLIGFAGLLFANAQMGGGLIGSDTETTLARGVGYAFFAWLSAINLFINSIFWAFMVDIFSIDQVKRMFAFIGTGGTLGALISGLVTNFVSGLTESVYFPVGSMLTGAGLFFAAIVVMLTLEHAAVRSRHSHLGEPAAAPAAVPGEKIGGRYFDGISAVGTSPYLLGIALFIIFLAISNTLIYFTLANFVFDETDTFSQRVGAFAFFDYLTQGATLFTQIFITTRLIRGLGVGWTLAILPLVTLAGFAVLAIWPAIRRDGCVPGFAPRYPLRDFAPSPGNSILCRVADGTLQGQDVYRRVSISRWRPGRRRHPGRAQYAGQPGADGGRHCSFRRRLVHAVRGSGPRPEPPRCRSSAAKSA